jgi:hypothetical protein
MNERKLPCANTHYLNRYMAELDREDAYQDELARRIAAIESTPHTIDDLYEYHNIRTLKYFPLEYDFKEFQRLSDAFANRSKDIRAWESAMHRYSLMVLGAMDACRSKRACDEAKKSMEDGE